MVEDLSGKIGIEMPIIYKTINKINNKIYVGVHYTSKNDGYLGSGIKLLRAVKKYGAENFKRITLERCKRQNTLKKESFWIKKLNSINPNIGYNLSEEGTGVYCKGFTPWNKGKTEHLSEYTLKKLRLAGKSDINKKNHLGRKNGAYLKLPFSTIRSFIKDYNVGYSIEQAAKRNKISRKKGSNLLKEYPRLILSEEERKYRALKKQIRIISQMLKSIDFNVVLLYHVYHVSKIIANKTQRDPSFIRRFLKKLKFTGSCKFKFGDIDINQFGPHNFSLLLKETGKYKEKRKPVGKTALDEAPTII